jgi:hypothetical protein
MNLERKKVSIIRPQLKRASNKIIFFGRNSAYCITIKFPPVL